MGVISSTKINMNKICNLLEKLIFLASSDVHSNYPSGVGKKNIYFRVICFRENNWPSLSIYSLQHSVFIQKWQRIQLLADFFDCLQHSTTSIFVNTSLPSVNPSYKTRYLATTFLCYLFWLIGHILWFNEFFYLLKKNTVGFLELRKSITINLF